MNLQNLETIYLLMLRCNNLQHTPQQPQKAFLPIFEPIKIQNLQNHILLVHFSDVTKKTPKIKFRGP